MLACLSSINENSFYLKYTEEVPCLTSKGTHLKDSNLTKKECFEHVFSFITKFEVDFMQSRKGKEIHLLIEKKENPTLKSYRVF